MQIIKPLIFITIFQLPGLLLGEVVIWITVVGSQCAFEVSEAFQFKGFGAMSYYLSKNLIFSFFKKMNTNSP